MNKPSSNASNASPAAPYDFVPVDPDRHPLLAGLESGDAPEDPALRLLYELHRDLYGRRSFETAYLYNYDATEEAMQAHLGLIRQAMARR